MFRKVLLYTDQVLAKGTKAKGFRNTYSNILSTTHKSDGINQLSIIYNYEKIIASLNLLLMYLFYIKKYSIPLTHLLLHLDGNINDVRTL